MARTGAQAGQDAEAETVVIRGGFHYFGQSTKNLRITVDYRDTDRYIYTIRHTSDTASSQLVNDCDGFGDPRGM